MATASPCIIRTSRLIIFTTRRRFIATRLQELAEACARHGIKLGLYYSQSVDWHEPGGFGNNWDFEDDKHKDKDGSYDHYLQTKVEPQLKELLTNYGPICEIFFDTPALMTPARAQRIAEIVHAAQPDCLIDGRLGMPGDYSTMGDNGIPNANVVGDWETPGELNHNWGFDQNDSDYKSPSKVLFNLFDIVSKGGNYLLDVGPTARGVIPPVAAANLETVGRWLKVNGDAIYGTTRSPFAEGFHGFGRKLRDDQGRPVELPFLDWRCTAKPGKLYFTLFHWPGEHFKLPGLPKQHQKGLPAERSRHASHRDHRCQRQPQRGPDPLRAQRHGHRRRSRDRGRHGRDSACPRTN